MSSRRSTRKVNTDPLSKGKAASFIGGITNAEDMHLLEGTTWVIASNMGDRTWSRGGFYAINTRDRSVHALQPSFGASPARPDENLYSSHGLDVRLIEKDIFELAAVNHGGRQSVDIYHVDTSSPIPQMTWTRSHILPDGVAGNAVAWLDGDDFVVTVPAARENLGTLIKAMRGKPTGYVLRWSGTWERLPDTDLCITNGIVVSPDGAALYVNGYAERNINKISLEGGGLLASAQVDFMPDNLRFAPDGTILTAGHRSSFLRIQLRVNMTSVPVCPVETAVAQVDPHTLETRVVYECTPSNGFGGGTTAIVVHDELWVTSFRAQSLLAVPLEHTGVRLDPSTK